MIANNVKSLYDVSAMDGKATYWHRIKARTPREAGRKFRASYPDIKFDKLNIDKVRA